MTDTKKDTAPSVATVDTHELVSKMTKWEYAERGAPAMAAWDEIIAHIDAHVAAQVAAKDAEIARLEHEFKNFHRMLCERFGYTHDETDWKRDQISLMEFISAQAAAPVVASESNKLDHECEFLQDWLSTAAEPCGKECCGHGIGGECCGDADPVFMTYPEFLSAMQARLKEVTALLSSQPSPAPVAMTDEQIEKIVRDVTGDYESEYLESDRNFYRDLTRAILAAQQEAV